MGSSNSVSSTGASGLSSGNNSGPISRIGGEINDGISSISNLKGSSGTTSAKILGRDSQTYEHWNIGSGNIGSSKGAYEGILNEAPGPNGRSNRCGIPKISAEIKGELSNNSNLKRNAGDTGAHNVGSDSQADTKVDFGYSNIGSSKRASEDISNEASGSSGGTNDGTISRIGAEVKGPISINSNWKGSSGDTGTNNVGSDSQVQVNSGSSNIGSSKGAPQGNLYGDSEPNGGTIGGAISRIGAEIIGRISKTSNLKGSSGDTSTIYSVGNNSQANGQVNTISSNMGTSKGAPDGLLNGAFEPSGGANGGAISRFGVEIDDGTINNSNLNGRSGETGLNKVGSDSQADAQVNTGSNNSSSSKGASEVILNSASGTNGRNNSCGISVIGAEIKGDTSNIPNLKGSSAESGIQKVGSNSKSDTEMKISSSSNDSSKGASENILNGVSEPNGGINGAEISRIGAEIIRGISNNSNFKVGSVDAVTQNVGSESKVNGQIKIGSSNTGSSNEVSEGILNGVSGPNGGTNGGEMSKIGVDIKNGKGSNLKGSSGDAGTYNVGSDSQANGRVNAITSNMGSLQGVPDGILNGAFGPNGGTSSGAISIIGAKIKSAVSNNSNLKGIFGDTGINKFGSDSQSDAQVNIGSNNSGSSKGASEDILSRASGPSGGNTAGPISRIGAEMEDGISNNSNLKGSSGGISTKNFGSDSQINKHWNFGTGKSGSSKGASEGNLNGDSGSNGITNSCGITRVGAQIKGGLSKNVYLKGIFGHTGASNIGIGAEIGAEFNIGASKDGKAIVGPISEAAADIKGRAASNNVSFKGFASLGNAAHEV